MSMPRIVTAGTRRGIGLGAYALVYALALVVLAREPGASAVEPLFVLGVLGIAFPLLALVLTRGARATPDPIARPRAEAGAALAWLAIFAFAVLGWGFSAVRAAVAEGTAQELAILAAKLLAMVAVPVLILGWFGIARATCWRQTCAGARSRCRWPEWAWPCSASRRFSAAG